MVTLWLVNLSVTLAPLSADAGVRGLSRLSLAEFHLDCHMRVLLFGFTSALLHRYLQPVSLLGTVEGKACYLFRAELKGGKTLIKNNNIKQTPRSLFYAHILRVG